MMKQIQSAHTMASIDYLKTVVLQNTTVATCSTISADIERKNASIKLYSSELAKELLERERDIISICTGYDCSVCRNAATLHKVLNREVEVMKGATISILIKSVRSHKARRLQFTHIILHVGTNGITNGTSRCGIVAAYKLLLLHSLNV